MPYLLPKEFWTLILIPGFKEALSLSKFMLALPDLLGYT